MSRDKSLDKIFDELVILIKQNKSKEFFSQIKQYHIAHGFNINYTNEYGNTLLHIACRSRNYDVAKKLIVDHNASTDIQNDDKRTALHIAAIYGSGDSALYLFKNVESKMNITNSSKIISLIIDKSPHTLLLKDKDNMTGKDYLDKHQDTDFNAVLGSRYKKYKKYVKFFDSLQKYSDQDDYNLTLSIFSSLRKY